MLDVDGDYGRTSLNALENKYGKLPETMKVKTGSGGFHFYFVNPKEEDYPNKVSFRKGLDLRAEGGFIVAPPSLHVIGNRYEWMGGKTHWLDLK